MGESRGKILESSKVIELVRDFKEKAKPKFDLQKVILFGSYAVGEARRWSDIDLLVVSKKVEDRPAFAAKLLGEWHLVQKKKVPVDFICFTPEEFARLSKKITIVRQALEEGIEI